MINISLQIFHLSLIFTLPEIFIKVGRGGGRREGGGEEEEERRVQGDFFGGFSICKGEVGW